jgi:hypothetical protein
VRIQHMCEHRFCRCHSSSWAIDSVELGALESADSICIVLLSELSALWSCGKLPNVDTACSAAGF